MGGSEVRLDDRAVRWRTFTRFTRHGMARCARDHRLHPALERAVKESAVHESTHPAQAGQPGCPSAGAPTSSSAQCPLRALLAPELHVLPSRSQARRRPTPALLLTKLPPRTANGGRADHRDQTRPDHRAGRRTPARLVSQRGRSCQTLHASDEARQVVAACSRAGIVTSIGLTASSSTARPQWPAAGARSLTRGAPHQTAHSPPSSLVSSAPRHFPALVIIERWASSSPSPSSRPPASAAEDPRCTLESGAKLRSAVCLSRDAALLYRSAAVKCSAVPLRLWLACSSLCAASLASHCLSLLVAASTRLFWNAAPSWLSRRSTGP